MRERHGHLAEFGGDLSKLWGTDTRRLCGEVASTDPAHCREQIIDGHHERCAQRPVLPAGDRDGEQEHAADNGERDKNDVVLGRLLGGDICVDLGVHCRFCRPVRIEQRLATQQEALLRGRITKFSIDRLLMALSQLGQNVEVRITPSPIH